MVSGMSLEKAKETLENSAKFRVNNRVQQNLYSEKM